MKDKNDFPDLSRTEAAIRLYDEQQVRLNALIESGKSNSKLEAAYDQLEKLSVVVGVAYGEDTKDRNNPETCRQLIRPGHKMLPSGYEESFVRRMVRLWREVNPT